MILSIQKRKAEEELRPVPSVVSLTRVLCGLVCFFYGFFHTTLFAQTSKEPVGENFEFFKMESESLKGMAKEILNHDSSRYKFELNKKFGAETKLRLFFTSEPFANRSGYHNHFVFHAKNDKLTEEVYNEIYAYFEWDRVETRPYDKYKAGLFYM